jgi:hypothetical protein
VVGVNEVGGEEVIAQRIGQWREQCAGSADPLRQQSAIELNAHPGAQSLLRFPLHGP